MKRYEVLICGFGGQGVIFAGKLLGHTAGLAGLETAQSASYGSEARGSACHAGVVLASEQIGYPKVNNPDLLIAMSQEGYDKFYDKVKPGGMIVFDCDLVKTTAIEGVERAGYQATKIATDLGKRNIANVLLLSIAASLGGFVTKEALIQALENNSPSAFKEINLKALAVGFRMGQ
ncbi:2-oxoacid:acceptor oxidoreductase family protein [bacterium]|nr:2-oxoacid:acceptor oxidoreductase family protein [bacterium]